MNVTQYNSIKAIQDRIVVLEREMAFLQLPATQRYPITELSYREPTYFDYNIYADEIIALLYSLMNIELQALETQFDNITVSGSLG